MILAALRHKFRDRGPVGFVADALELATACAAIGIYELAFGGAIIAGVVVGLPLLAWDARRGRP